MLAWMDLGLHLAVSPGKYAAFLQQAAEDLQWPGEALPQTAHRVGALSPMWRVAATSGRGT
ncbi:hypothetical protein [Paraburkholderia phenazinium]|uniref:hypothetical protein n=1 Tax=Paraburkholderia phenazinium TaxID=60549 RepID=UPI000B889BA7|nr:hypothetical protein [Paraburkholderia phenazinium]